MLEIYSREWVNTKQLNILKLIIQDTQNQVLLSQSSKALIKIDQVISNMTINLQLPNLTPIHQLIKKDLTDILKNWMMEIVNTHLHLQNKWQWNHLRKLLHKLIISMHHQLQQHLIELKKIMEKKIRNQTKLLPTNTTLKLIWILFKEKLLMN
jgi:hypothetical protein